MDGVYVCVCVYVNRQNGPHGKIARSPCALHADLPHRLTPPQAERWANASLRSDMCTILLVFEFFLRLGFFICPLGLPSIS